MSDIKIKLKKKETDFLKEFVKKGTKKAREIVRANVLLLANEGYGNEFTSKAIKVHRQSIWRIKKKYVEGGLAKALKEEPRPGQPRKYTNKHEAEIIAQTCANPPKGYNRWTIRLLTKEFKKKKGFKTINRESVRLILKKVK